MLSEQYTVLVTFRLTSQLFLKRCLHVYSACEEVVQRQANAQPGWETLRPTPCPLCQFFNDPLPGSANRPEGTNSLKCKLLLLGSVATKSRLVISNRGNYNSFVKSWSEYRAIWPVTTLDAAGWDFTKRGRHCGLKRRYHQGIWDVVIAPGILIYLNDQILINEFEPRFLRLKSYISFIQQITLRVTRMTMGVIVILKRSRRTMNKLYQQNPLSYLT